MSSSRRVVRATAAFFEDLDRQLPPERGPDGEPSTNDFQVFELLRTVERFATGFDELDVRTVEFERDVVSIGAVAWSSTSAGYMEGDGTRSMFATHLARSEGSVRPDAADP